MNQKVGILLVGIGGYGNTYVKELLDNPGRENWEIKGVVDIYPERCSKYNELLEMKIPMFSSIDDFYGESSADLAVISSPIQYHTDQACKALSYGSNVLCEKPVAATIQDVLKIIEQRDKAEKFVDIGYQWSHNDAVLRLKQDILDGKLGKPVRMKTIVLWPRDRDYYARGWAGKKKDSSGRWVLDSVAANATAHYLHNMFFVLGDAMDQSARLVSVTAETYKANPIENFDTAVIRARTDKGVEILFLASHAVPMEAYRGPDFEYVFENAVVRYRDVPQSEESLISAVFNDGTVIEYGCPNGNVQEKLWIAIKAAKYDSRIICGLEAASAHTVCINCTQESVPEPLKFPKEIIRTDEAGGITWVNGLAEAMGGCYENWTMLHETGLPWTHVGREISAMKYEYFEGNSA